MRDIQLPVDQQTIFLDKSFLSTCWCLMVTYPIAVYNNLFAHTNFYQLTFVTCLAISTAILLSIHERLSQIVKRGWYLLAISSFATTVILRNFQDAALILDILLIVLFAPVFGLKRTFVGFSVLMTIQVVLIITLLPERNGAYITVLWGIIAYTAGVATLFPLHFLLTQINRHSRNEEG